MQHRRELHTVDGLEVAHAETAGAFRCAQRELDEIGFRYLAAERIERVVRERGVRGAAAGGIGEGADELWRHGAGPGARAIAVLEREIEMSFPNTSVIARPDAVAGTVRATHFSSWGKTNWVARMKRAMTGLGEVRLASSSR